MSDFLILLDLPRGSYLSIDGQPVTLQRDDFVGFHSIPNDIFHLVLTRPGPPSPNYSSTNEPQLVASSISTGIVAFETGMMRRYLRDTEEMSSESVDEVTYTNLVRQMQGRALSPERLVGYSHLITQEKAEMWKRMTGYVSKRLLQKRGVENGGKIVPGSFEEFNEDKEESKRSGDSMQIDGKALCYPPIAVIDKSQRHTTHPGTKRFLSQLSSSARTQIFVSEFPKDLVFEYILKNFYDDSVDVLLGDLQLSYVTFMYMQCFSSLQHWRDLLAMLCRVSSSCMLDHEMLYTNLIDAIYSQVQSMDANFFEEVEFTGDNFLIPSLRQLLSTLDETEKPSLCLSGRDFSQFLRGRFPNLFEDNSLGEDGRVDDFLGGSDDEDGPVVVSSEDIRESLARIVHEEGNAHQIQYPSHIRCKFPLLFAAKMSHEDILMTCARALDEKNDVSLVREAAAYLEDIEAKGLS